MKSYILIAGILALVCQPVLQENVDVSSQNAAVQRSLKKESLKLNLKTLRESDSRDEMRVWVGFGLITPRCFTLKRVKGVEQAMYYATTSKRISDVPGKKYQVENIATPLTSPTSGWKAFDVFLKSRGIDSPIKLTSDFNYQPDPDGELLVIEMKSQGVYSMVFFPTVTKTPDGMKALDVCHKIENEFKIKMGC